MMYTPEDSKEPKEFDVTDTTNLRHSGVPTIQRPEGTSLTGDALVRGGSHTLRDVPAGRAPTSLTPRDDLYMLQYALTKCLL